MTDHAVEDEVWITDEIGLASFIALRSGVDPEFEWNGEACSFLFPKTEKAMALVVEYVAGQALVEPREFYVKASNIRKAMFRNRPFTRR